MKSEGTKPLDIPYEVDRLMAHREDYENQPAEIRRSLLPWKLHCESLASFSEGAWKAVYRNVAERSEG